MLSFPLSQLRLVLCAWRWLGCVVAVSGLVVTAAEQEAPDFGKDVKLAPFVVSGKKVGVAIHARTDSDRRYGEKFAEEVLEVAFHTAPEAKGRGLVIVGREGEPHPVEIMRKFLALAEGGQLGPELAAKAGEVSALMKELKRNLQMDDETVKAPPPPPDPKTPEPKMAKDAKAPKPELQIKLTFDRLMPALPLPLEGVMGKLYQLSWAEGFDAARVDQKLRTLTLADLQGGALGSYDWIFYLPPRNAYVAVQDSVVKEVIEKEKMGFFKRAAIKTALVVFKPAVKKGVEGMRRGMLYMTVLRADGSFSREDINDLTRAYVRVLMPDFKYTAGSEHDRVLAAVDKQKLANEDYAQNPYVAPSRLAEFDAAAYAKFEGTYGEPKSKSTWRLTHDVDGAYVWQLNQRTPTKFYPAGERLFVAADGKQTMEFTVDEQGAVIGGEGRRHRQRWKIPGRLPEPVSPKK
jgi:hypothetical protein